MAVNMAWKVIYGFEDGNKKQGWDSQTQVTVIAADSKEATIRSVLTSNGISRPGATVKIISVSRADVPGGGDNVLS
jgi:hypothetical protein